MHTNNIETAQPTRFIEYRAWCPCGWEGEWFTVEDDAQDQSHYHVNG